MLIRYCLPSRCCFGFQPKNLKWRRILGEIYNKICRPTAERRVLRASIPTCQISAKVFAIIALMVPTERHTERWARRWMYARWHFSSNSTKASVTDVLPPSACSWELFRPSLRKPDRYDDLDPWLTNVRIIQHVVSMTVVLASLFLDQRLTRKKNSTVTS